MYYEDIVIERQGVDSSNVKSLGYNEEYSIMALEMLSDTLYYYLDIPKHHFDTMISWNKSNVEISSIGSYLNRFIKGNYRYVRVR